MSFVGRWAVHLPFELRPSESESGSVSGTSHASQKARLGSLQERCRYPTTRRNQTSLFLVKKGISPKGEYRFSYTVGDFSEGGHRTVLGKPKAVFSFLSLIVKPGKNLWTIRPPGPFYSFRGDYNKKCSIRGAQ